MLPSASSWISLLSGLPGAAMVGDGLREMGYARESAMVSLRNESGSEQKREELDGVRVSCILSIFNHARDGCGRATASRKVQDEQKIE
jgi:hypothetical protein